MLTKSTLAGPSSKRHQGEGPTQDTNLALVFHTQAHQGRYTCLSRRYFRESKEIDWDILREMGHEQEVQQLLGAGVWCQLFLITNNTLRIASSRGVSYIRAAIRDSSLPPCYTIQL